MGNESFRDVLNRFLEEKDGLSARETAPPHSTTGSSSSSPPPDFMMFLNWKKSDTTSRIEPHNRAANYGGVVKPAARPPEPTVKKAAPIEVLIPLSQLSPADHQHITILKKLGGEGLDEGLSTKRLRRIHRTLAKRLHPDQFRGDSSYFRQLQSAVEGLRVAVSRLEKAATHTPSNASSGLACDSESASAPESQRRDAA